MIEVDHVSKSFGGRPAVKDVSFQVPRGEILGFLGPNGAGKTTTMRILTGYLPATSGTARVAGFDVFEQSMEVRRRVGYLPETPPLYNEMTVRSYLTFVARLKGVPKRQVKQRIDAVASQCGATDVLPRVIGHLSKGYRQRVGLCQALINDPPVLILDEPTVGLDPAQIVEIRQVIKGLAGDHTIVFSTHILPEVTATCSSVVIINYGQAVVAGPLSELAAGEGGGQRLRLHVSRDEEWLLADLSAIPGVSGASREAGRPGSYLLRVDAGPELRERLAAHVVTRGWGLLELTPLTPTLEDIYLSLTGGAAAAGGAAA
ncbi:MAG TPA: ATP-binding cassette domain-containing protein [Candidatus Polarisedimenticolia bacterium]|nr:ATP-binding cassette domain-containing protein [Candidatus Polarisedimenticolia bacterium]